MFQTTNSTSFDLTSFAPDTATLQYNGRVYQSPKAVAPAELPETLSYNGRTYYPAQRVADPKLSQTLSYNGRVYQVN